ncbi:MAG TPA: hypothetical protein PKE03_04310 [Bacteroidales bacterium]|nr:hypothetical protein [Bacteroidales bacterium]
MKINYDNYEAFLLDFIEGRLDAATAEALKRFIVQHPDLGSWDELTADLPVLEAEVAVFSSKESLQKPEIKVFGNIDESNYETYFTAWHENVLTNDEKASVERFLQLNPWLEDEFRLAGMVYLVPDEAISFPDKAAIIRKAPVIAMMTGNLMRVAAAVALLFTLSMWWMRQLPDRTEPLQALVTETEAVDSAENHEETSLAESVIFEINPAGAETVPRNRKVQKPAAKTVETPQQRYDELPTLQKRASGIVALNPHGTFAFEKDDLETRLLIAMLLETGQSSQSSAGQQRIRQALVGINKGIDFMQRRQERLSPEHVLAAGVGMYNLLTDNDVELVKEYHDGQLQSLVLQSERLGWRRTLP